MAHPTMSVAFFQAATEYGHVPEPFQVILGAAAPHLELSTYFWSSASQGSSARAPLPCEFDGQHDDSTHGILRLSILTQLIQDDLGLLPAHVVTMHFLAVDISFRSH